MSVQDILNKASKEVYKPSPWGTKKIWMIQSTDSLRYTHKFYDHSEAIQALTYLNQTRKNRYGHDIGRLIPMTY